MPLLFAYGINRFSHNVAHMVTQLRNKFNFSEVHRSMNAMGYVQSK